MSSQLKAPAQLGTGSGGQGKARNHHSESPLQRLLHRLDKVRETGSNQYLARCPAHDDGRPSLSVKECSDGTLLLHCFAACPATDVLAAVGMELAELFPDHGRLESGPKSRFERRIGPKYALAAVAYEIQVATVIIGDVRQSRTIDDEAWNRLLQAALRIRSAQEVA